MLRRLWTLSACFIALALVVVGCGGDGGDATLGKKTTSPTAPAVTAAPSRDVSYIASVKLRTSSSKTTICVENSTKNPTIKAQMNRNSPSSERSASAV